MAIPEYLEEYKKESKERARTNLEKMKVEKAEFKEREKAHLEKMEAEKAEFKERETEWFSWLKVNRAEQATKVPATKGAFARTADPV